MSGKDYLEKVKGERGLLERIMGYIPGYHGYKEKELRRESDRLVRMEAVNRLKAAKTAMRRAFANPAMVQKLAGEDTYRYEALNSRMDRITQRIDRAVAGYQGLFDAVKVKEDALDKLYEFDNALNDGLLQISGTIDAIEAAAAAKQGIPEAISRFDDQCRYLVTTFKQRKEVLTS